MEDDFKQRASGGIGIPGKDFFTGDPSTLIQNFNSKLNLSNGTSNAVGGIDPTNPFESANEVKAEY